MSFEEEFPSLWREHINSRFMIDSNSVREYCLDKQRVRDAWGKAMLEIDHMECGRDPSEVFFKELGLE